MNARTFIASSLICVFGSASSAHAEAEGVINARWCRDGGTNSIKDQSMGKNGGECIKYLAEFGLTTQHELAMRAIGAVKGGHDDDAIRYLKVCQCHNGNAQASLDRDRQAVLAWLMSQ